MNWQDYFTYDPASGLLYWKERRLSSFKTDSAGVTWNKRHAGKEAGSRRSRDGHNISVWVYVDGVQVPSHRIIYEMMIGPIPDGHLVDHKDGDGWNNRIDNLRAATNRQNRQNRRLSRNSASGYKGVWWHARKRRWLAYISHDGKCTHLGLFKLKEDAARRYNEEAVKRHGEFARINIIPLTL